MSGSARAQIEITASSSRLAAGLGQALGKVKGFAATAASGVGKVFSKLNLGDVGKHAIGNVVGNVATRGLDMFTEAATGVMAFERNLTRFQIATNGSTASTAAMREQVRQVSKETGVAAEQVLAGAASYIAVTGDADGASAAMSTFARAAQASGSSVEDIATATAGLHDAFGLNARDAEASISGLIAQGKAGAVEFKNLAAEVSGVAPQFADFGKMGTAEGIGELGAAMQIARKGFGDASQAATGLRAMMTSLKQHAVEFQQAGVRVYDKDPKTGIQTMRKLSDIWRDINASKLVKNPTLMQKMWGREEAVRTYEQFRKFPELYDQLIAAGQDYGTVERDLNTYRQSSAGQFDITMNNLKASMASVFTPERVQAFADALGTAVDMAAKLISGLKDIGDWVDRQRNADKHDENAAVAAAQALSPEDRQKAATEHKIEGVKRRARKRGFFESVASLAGGSAADASGMGEQLGEGLANAVGVNKAITSHPFITGAMHERVAARIDPWRFSAPGGGEAGRADAEEAKTATKELVGAMRDLAKQLGNKAANAPVVVAKVDIGKNDIVKGHQTASSHARRVAAGGR